MVPFVFLTLAAPRGQVQPWEADLKQAEKRAATERQLIVMQITEAGDKFAIVLPKALIAPGFAFSKSGPKSRIELWDSDERVMGRIISPFTPEFAESWFKTADRVWRHHDALVFRSKGRMDDQSTLDLVFSYACRGETEKAAQWVGHIPSDKPLEGADLTLAIYAMALEWSNSADRAAEAYQRLELRTKNPEFKALAWIGEARMWRLDRRDDAILSLKKASSARDVPKNLKDYADAKLEELGN